MNLQFILIVAFAILKANTLSVPTYGDLIGGRSYTSHVEMKLHNFPSIYLLMSGIIFPPQGQKMPVKKQNETWGEGK